MGITNIRSSYGLISRSNSMPCLMPELGCRLILDGSADTDLDLARYVSRLSRGLSDQWVTFDANGNMDSQKGNVSHPATIPESIYPSTSAPATATDRTSESWDPALYASWWWRVSKVRAPRNWSSGPVWSRSPRWLFLRRQMGTMWCLVGCC
ncbi:hypothetical protein VTK56DRAFT_4065 [Thermocarpiscus australiensis]